MKYILYRDLARHWRWRLVAVNGRIIANSGEGYLNRNDCLGAIRLVKGTSNAPIYEQ